MSYEGIASDYKKFLGIRNTQLNESLMSGKRKLWAPNALVETAREATPEPLSEMAALKSRKKLLSDLKDIADSGIAAPAHPVPDDVKKLADETFGKESMIYFLWTSPEDRKKGEAELVNRGHKVHTKYWPGSARSEIQVSYFKGWHWDESEESIVEDLNYDEVYDVISSGLQESDRSSVESSVTQKFAVSPEDAAALIDIYLEAVEEVESEG